MNKRRFSIRALMLACGCALLIVAVVLLSFQLMSERRVRECIPIITEELTKLLADRTPGFTGIQGDTRMPVAELEGELVCGLLECGNETMPVFAEFDRQNAARRPAVYSGSVYDGSLVLGGDPESFGFLQTLAGGETVTFTDMLGCSFAYCVDSIRHAKELSVGLESESASLTFFARIGGSYLIVRCTEVT